jgi:hypothetical protein
MVMAFWRTIIVSGGLSHPDPESLNSNKKGGKLPLLSADGWAALPFDNISGRFFKGGETLS